MRKSNDLNAKEGSALLLVMIIMTVVGILGMGQLTNARLASLEVVRSMKTHQFASLADMGLREFRAIVMNEKNRRNFVSLNVISSGSEPTFSRKWVRDDQNEIIGGYDVFVTEATSSDPSEAHYKIRSVAYDKDLNEMAQVESYVRLTTVSEDVWGSNDEGGVLFVTNDKIWGSIRSNNPFYFSGAPEIYGTVKTSASCNVIDGHYSTASPTNFYGGVEFNLPPLPFDSTLVTGLAADAEQTVNDESIITFKANGSYEVIEKNIEMFETGRTEYTYEYTDWRGHIRTSTWVGDDFIWSNTIVSTAPEMGENVSFTTNNYAIDNLGVVGTDSDNIIYVNGTVTVSGEVAGTVSVVASDSIIIDQSIVYASQADDPNPTNWGEDEPEIDERLGLYATTKVMATGADDTDINIHAAIYVSDGNDYSYYRGFCVENYNHNFHSPYINLYGSLIQKQRGAVGTSGGKGFYKNYHQDARFLTSPPPGSPLSSPEFFGWSSSRLGS